jgi:hypothetical protein
VQSPIVWVSSKLILLTTVLGNHVRSVLRDKEENGVRLIITLLFVLALPITGFAHPADSATPNEVDQRYGTGSYGYPAEWSLGDLSFSSTRPMREHLTHSERYMLAGARASGGDLRPWYLSVLQLVQAYEAAHGSVPDRLNDSIVRELMGDTLLGTIDGESLKSPITGLYPELRSVHFTPGALYMRPLTSAELQHFCSKDKLLGKLVNEGLAPNPRDGGKLTRPARLMGKVWYIRVYGESSVIKEDLVYASTAVR